MAVDLFVFFVRFLGVLGFGLGFGGLRFWVQGSGFAGLRFRVWGGLGVWGFIVEGFGVWGLGLGGLGFQAP